MLDVERPNENSHFVQYRKYADDLATAMSPTLYHVKKITKDLERKGKLLPGFSLKDYVFAEMHFHESLQNMAFASLCRETPRPYDTRAVSVRFDKTVGAVDKIYGVMPEFIPLISLEEESSLRLHALNVTTQVVNNMEPREAVKHPSLPIAFETMVSGIINSASIVTFKSEKSIDPSQYLRNSEAVSLLLQAEPKTLYIDGRWHWAIRVPAKLTLSKKAISELAPGLDEDKAANLLDDLRQLQDNLPIRKKFSPQELSQYIVVDDIDRNAELSTLLFSSEEALAYMLKKHLKLIQPDLRDQLSSEFGNIVMSSFSEDEAKVKEINDPIRLDFFNKLLGDVQKKSQAMEITYIIRNSNDYNKFIGEAHVNDESESPSIVANFTVRAGRPGELIFAVPVDNMNHSIRDMQKIEFSTQNIFVRAKIVNGKLVFESLPSTSDNSGVDIVESLFETVELVSFLDWFKFGDTQLDDLDRTAESLHGCQSSIEFMNMLQEFGKASFPRKQIIINSKNIFDIEVTRQVPASPATTGYN